MEANTEPEHPGECRTCLGSREKAIHAATVRVHQWLRAEIARKLERPAERISAAA